MRFGSVRATGLNASGFTLLEILLVLLLLALVAGLAAPRLMIGELDLARREAVHFRNVLQWLADQAVYSGDTYRLRLNLAEQKYECLVLIDREFVGVTDPLARSRDMGGNVVAMRWLPYDDGFTDERSELVVDFTPFGPASPVLVGFYPAEDPEMGYSVFYTPAQPRPGLVEGINDWNTIHAVAAGNETL